MLFYIFTGNTAVLVYADEDEIYEQKVTHTNTVDNDTHRFVSEKTISIFLPHYKYMLLKRLGSCVSSRLTCFVETGCGIVITISLF